MFEKLKQAEKELELALAELDPGVLEPNTAASLVERFGRMERLCSSLEGLAHGGSSPPRGPGLTPEPRECPLPLAAPPEARIPAHICVSQGFGVGLGTSLMHAMIAGFRGRG